MVIIDRLVFKLVYDGLTPPPDMSDHGYLLYVESQLEKNIATMEEFFVVHYIRCRPRYTAWGRLKDKTKRKMIELTKEQIDRRTKHQLEALYAIDVAQPSWGNPK